MESQHIPNVDGKIAPRSFWLVKARALVAGTDKPTGIAMTFDNKDAAIRCYKTWALTAAFKQVKLMKSDVAWEEFVPQSKADKDLFEKAANV